MAISLRTRLSLSQLLGLQGHAEIKILFEKHGIPFDDWAPRFSLDEIKARLSAASEDQLLGLLDEVVRTSGGLRVAVSPRYVFDERWKDLEICLLLDNYKIDRDRLISIEPTIPGAEPLEDDLTLELRKSGLAEAEEIVRTIGNATDDFRKEPADYNGCLSNSRVALQTLATAIARVRQRTNPGSFDETKWGQVLAYLRVSGFVTQKEEEGIAGVFGFVSPGAHSPVGLSEQEMTRLGRSLILSMCYFLVKRYNAQAALP